MIPKFSKIPCKSITMESIKDFLADRKTKRINFAWIQQNALRPNKDRETFAKWWFDIPFTESIELLLSKDLGIPIAFPSKNYDNYCRYFKDEDKDQLDKYKETLEKCKNLVFLRDCLDISLALSMNIGNANERTELGEAEYQVKYHPQGSDTCRYFNLLVSETQKWLEQLPYLKEADYICCVPTSHTFMKQIVSQLTGFGFKDISAGISWISKQKQLKEAENSIQKLDILNRSGLKISTGIDLKNKTVLLMDDLYQSGTTMQFVAMKLKQAGARHVYGLALVKALSND
ncbi:MAG: phosphoribosyltransferase [Prevotella sp.]|nr:hypothetical protein [Prevotella sp.]MCH4100670.1 phosphoribosyltransferase [Prevotella sp.]MCH4216912.1 phosphoribosyltransferase [Prevotella sp.]MCI1473246.1 phosphoribosyltransferase [Prevotella sp.]MCI1549248.1 phosphoribosyltransferase [Prevotella sp.]MCI1596825.1 phosphoribosyltransferase [Prevotella sp.]